MPAQRYGDKVRTPFDCGREELSRPQDAGGQLLEQLADRPGLADDLISALEARAVVALRPT